MKRPSKIIFMALPGLWIGAGISLVYGYIMVEDNRKIRLLRGELFLLSKMPDSYDAIEEYRRWFHYKGVPCDNEDGTLMDHCFEYQTIWQFADWWREAQDEMED